MINNETFIAWADPALVGVTSRFFDNGILSITRELLQNARRSGATVVRMTQADGKWHYSDNGPGCAPRRLMGLGSSSWGDEVRDSETPAGCGFAALSRRNPSVRSPKLGWSMDLTEQHFNGVLPISPDAFTEDPTGSGLEVCFDLGSMNEASHVRDMAKFMPIDFYLNGVLMPSHEVFLSLPKNCEASIAADFDKAIRVLVGLTSDVSGRMMFNYNGWVVESSDYQFDAMFRTTGKVYSYLARIDVSSESALPLELPQRNQIISGERLTKLKRFVRHLALQLAAENLSEVSVTDPSLWLEAREQGYEGPVCYPKFAGRLVTRDDSFEMADYDITEDNIGNDGIGDVGDYVTWDELVADPTFHFCPSKEVVGLLAQTKSYVGEGEESEYKCAADEYFPGIKLVRPLRSAPFTKRTKADEGAGWFEKQWVLYHERREVFDSLRVIASCPLENGLAVEVVADMDNLDLITRRKVACNWIRICLVDAEQRVVAYMDAPALFEIFGDSYSAHVGFAVTKSWLRDMPKTFTMSVAEVAAKARGWHDDSDFEEEMSQVIGSLDKGLARLTDYEGFVIDRLRSAVESLVRDSVRDLDVTPEGVVIRVPADSVYGAVTEVELIPAWHPAYTFRGSYGTVRCDENGRRAPFGYAPIVPENGPAEKDAYPEYHSFDVESLRQLGSTRTEMDILDVGGWHDSTKRIYITPVVAHTLWNAELLSNPVGDTTDGEVLAALAKAMEDGKVSATLYSAWKCDPQFQSLMSQAEDIVGHKNIPEFKEIWTM